MRTFIRILDGHVDGPVGFLLSFFAFVQLLFNVFEVHNKRANGSQELHRVAAPPLHLGALSRLVFFFSFRCLHPIGAGLLLLRLPVCFSS